MAHWSSKYVGRKYIPNQYDCTHLVVDVVRNEFAKDVNLPTERVDSTFGLSNLIDRYKETYAVETDRPRDGSIVLMKCKNRLNHIGIYCEINGKNYVLHNQKNVGSVILHKLTEIGMWNISIHSYYELKDKEQTR